MIDIDALNWNLPLDEQQARISSYQPVQDDDIQALILPWRKKDCWNNCAILLSTVDDKRLIPFLPQILEWYRDLNWPGLDVISERIRRLPDDKVKEAVCTALVNAKSEKDTEWYENICCSFHRFLQETG